MFFDGPLTDLWNLLGICVDFLVVMAMQGKVFKPSQKQLLICVENKVLKDPEDVNGSDDRCMIGNMAARGRIFFS